MKNQTFRAVVAAGPVAALAGILMAAPAQAQQTWYAGAWASNGDGDCAGQGYYPTGGCAPQILGLSFATASIYGRRGNANVSSGTADLASASLVILERSPIDGSVVPTGAANLTETFTILGDMPSPVNVTVTVLIDSVVNGPDSIAGPVMAVGLGNGEGTKIYYERRINFGTCGAVNPRGEVCDLGYGHIVRPFSYTETVWNDHRSFRVDASLAGGYQLLELDATATLSLTLPEGLSYTTASGVFPMPAIPEPQTWALLLAGLAFVGLQSRRKLGGLSRTG